MELDFHLIVPPGDDRLYDAWKTALDKELPHALRSRFHFVRSRLDNLPGTRFDAIISPANSYGRMDGSFDDAISKLLSPPTDYFALTRFIQRELYVRWRGFAPPGSATTLLLPHDIVDAQKGTTGCKYVILCPTMHWPQDIVWNRDVVYNIVWALLAEIDRHNSTIQIKDENAGAVNTQSAEHETGHGKPPIRTILMSGLGTGIGNLPYARFAAQFVMAVKNFDEAVHMPKKWSSLGWDDVVPIIERLNTTWSAHS